MIACSSATRSSWLLAPVKYMLGGLVVHPDNMMRNVDGAFEYGGRHDGSRANRWVERKRTTRSQRSVLRFLKGKGGYRPVDRGV
jgi:hypothetical protein